MADITHPELVSALVKDPKLIMDTLSLTSIDLWHAATGVAGEGGELLEGILLMQSNDATLEETRENLTEESGDLYFYTEQLVQRTGIKLDWDAIATFARNAELTPDLAVLYAARVAVFSSQVLDTVKKHAIYNKPLMVETLTTQLTEMSKWLMSIGYMFGIERSAALIHNIAKLKVRYEGLKYSDKAADERADKLERKFFGSERTEQVPVKAPLEPRGEK